MITITGSTDTAESRAAHALRDLILVAWPDAESPHYQIRLIASAKVWTASTKDLDVLVLIRAERPVATGMLDGEGRPVSLLSLCLVVEVKDNADFEFEGNKLWVRYGKIRESTSDQAEKQKFALRN